MSPRTVPSTDHGHSRFSSVAFGLITFALSAGCGALGYEDPAPSSSVGDANGPETGDDNLPLGGTGGVSGENSTGGSSAGAASNTGGTDDGTPEVIPDRGPGTPILPNGRGPTVHFVAYEAEDMATNGAVLGPTRQVEQVAAEASGRRAVRLSTPEHGVSFVNRAASNSIVVRYSIPDGGHESWATLSVYVDDQLRTKLDVTSRYSWTYGDESDAANPSVHENPNSGRPHHFFDEARALIGNVPVGSTVSVRKSNGDNAAHYDIDLIEMENVPGPLPQPAGTINITDCGATPNDNTDDTGAIQNCLETAEENSQGLFIPEGTFRVLSDPLSVPGIAISGAGMWYSSLSGFFARLDCYIPGCQYRDFSVLGDTVHRDDTSPETAFGGNGSSNVLLERIWVEHTKTGYWTGAETNNLVIRASRFRNLMADGVNFYGGTSNSIVEESHFRNTGDDAVAGWSHNPFGPNTSNIIRHNYVQLPWKANCFALYGGTNNVIEENVCADTVQYPGVFLAREFASHGFSGTTRITNNTLIRAGGYSFGKGHGALKLAARDGSVAGVEVTGMDIISPTYSAIQVEGGATVDSVWLTDINVSAAGDAVFFLEWSAQGALDANNITATNTSAGVWDDSEGDFTILRGTGNSGW